jgi:hypothetical protein
VLCSRTDWEAREFRRESWQGDVSGTILDRLTPHLGQTLVRRDVIQYFDEDFTGAEDVDWWLRSCRVAPVTTAPVVGMRYRRHNGVRNNNGTLSRVEGSQHLLEVHAEYYSAHPRAAAFRWKRIGLLAETLGDSSLARRALLRSARLRPTPRTLWHLVRQITP